MSHVDYTAWVDGLMMTFIDQEPIRDQLVSALQELKAAEKQIQDGCDSMVPWRGFDKPLSPCSSFSRDLRCNNCHYRLKAAIAEITTPTWRSWHPLMIPTKSSR